MATEIFIEPELENLSDEITASEWFELATNLGLENQISLADKSEKKKAPPYTFADPKTMNIISAICPRRVDYKEYRVSTIPLDVMQEISKCIDNKWYYKIEIAYDDKSPDPFVIGTLTDSWSSPKHIIARWGAELLPFEILENKAVERLMNEKRNELELVKFKTEQALNNMDAHIRGLLGGNSSISLPF